MEKWIYELILSVITVAGTIIALVQTRQQMRLSNKQALFEKRLNTYMFVKGLMELCNSNKAHFREYRDDVCLSNTIIFCFLTNNSYLKELGDAINNSSDDNYRVKLLFIAIFNSILSSNIVIYLAISRCELALSGISISSPLMSLRLTEPNTVPLSLFINCGI